MEELKNHPPIAANYRLIMHDGCFRNGETTNLQRRIGEVLPEYPHVRLIQIVREPIRRRRLKRQSRWIESDWAKGRCSCNPTRG